MKKCASCSKDLPEAALHCVFCGAKQPPAPAVQPGLAKTAFGYSQNEVMQQLRGPGTPQAGAPYQPPQTAPYQSPPAQRPGPSQPPPTGGMGYQATQLQPPPQQPQQPGPRPGPSQPPPYGAPGYPQPGPGAPGGLAPTPASSAPTVFSQPQAGGYQPPQAGGYQPPQAGGYQPPQAGGYQPPQAGAYQVPQPAPYAQQPMGTGPMSGGMGINAPNPHTPLPIEPMSGSVPYLASQTAVRGGHASDPFKDSLRLMMFIWGAVLLASFVTPVAIEPKLGFHWEVFTSDAPLALKLPSMLIAAVGLLGIVLALIPMVSLPRGLLAALLGLAAIFVPMAIGSFPKWIVLVDLLGMLTLVSGLLLRNEYTDSLLARILVTLGVICVLVPMLVPDHGNIPLVGLFKELIHLPGKQKVLPVLELGMVVIAVMCLLAWIPGPATGGAKVLAWLVILWPTALLALVTLLVGGDIGDHVKESPYEALMAWSAPATYMVLTGYGVATVIGKQLE